MQIYGPTQVHSAQSVNPPHHNRPAQSPNNDATGRITDEVQISQGAQEAASDEIRLDRVLQIREAIANGSYETPEKLDLALDRLLDEIA